MEIDSLEPPAWLGLGSQAYRDLLRRKAVANKRRDQKRGGRYSIKQALQTSSGPSSSCSSLSTTTTR
jgi:hypothetical protein